MGQRSIGGFVSPFPQNYQEDRKLVMLVSQASLGSGTMNVNSTIIF